MQARFLVPLAISLGFGVMFTTFVILVLVPVLAILQKIAGQGDPKNEVRTQSTAATPSNTDHEQETELAAARELLETT